MNPLYKFLKKDDENPRKFRNVIYAPFYEGHVFFFGYGCVVFWELTDDEISVILKKLKKFETDNVATIHASSESYFVVQDSETEVHQNEIRLNKEI